ncbi:MAG: hypothetical protein ACK4TA_14335 [Saprospiraceae bacterium]
MERTLYPFFLLLLIIQNSDTPIIISNVIIQTVIKKTFINTEICAAGNNLEDVMKTLKACNTLEDLLDYAPAKGAGGNLWITDLDLGMKKVETRVYYIDSTKFSTLNVTCLINNDSIKFGVINPYTDFIIFHENQPYLLDYLNTHNSFYYANLTYADLKKAFSKWQRLAIACGNGASYYSDEAKIMLQSIETVNKKPLNIFIRSIIPEIQAYGVIGLMALKDRGVSLTEDENKITEYLLERNSEIRMCRTCVSDNKPLQFAVEYWLKMIHSEDFEIVNGKFSKIEN